MDEPYAQDRDGFEAFFTAHYRRVLGSLTISVGDRELAADAAAEAFTRAVAAWPRVSRMQSPQGWTYRVAFNYARRHARRRSSEVASSAAARLQEDIGARDSGSLEFWEMLRRLPQRQRMATALRYGADLTEGEVAQIMGVRRSTVSSTLAAALATIEKSVSVEHRDLREGTPA